MQPTITVTESGIGFEYLRDAVNHLQNAQVYVGIPEAETGRDDAGPNNAGLLYIHTHGSEVMHIPPRPVVEPAIEADRQKLEAILGKAAVAQLENRPDEVKRLLELAGRRGANDAKRWFTDPRNGWPRNKLTTIRRKLNKLTGKRFRKALDILTDAGELGDVSEIDTPLIDSGQLRKALTYVTEYK